MIHVEVRTPGGEYTVAIGAGARSTLPGVVASLKPSSIHLVVDSRVDHLHGDAVLGHISAASVPVHRHVIPAGEASKCAHELLQLWRGIVQAGCDRRACVVALGGGVVGDLAGFAAATVLRGISFIQVPTTLLAMVDASVGGKTGIDLPEGKNLVGAFHQPRGVVMDTDFLDTLPERELRAGWAEVVKTAAIRDARLFEQVEASPPGRIGRGALARVIETCVRIKADIVGSDEREAGLRRILNFGHTLAHALETQSGYADWLHGEAVSVGMAFAGELGEALGLSEPGTARRLRSCLEAAGLPVRARGGAAAELLEIMARDKKRGPAGIAWVLVPRIGEAMVPEGIHADRVEEALRRFLG